MPCLVALLALISPRVALFFMAVFSNQLSHAFGSWVTPLIGFFVLPWTTLAYAVFWGVGAGDQVTGVEYAFVVAAFLFDLAALFGGKEARGRRGAR